MMLIVNCNLLRDNEIEIQIASLNIKEDVVASDGQYLIFLGLNFGDFERKVLFNMVENVKNFAIYSTGSDWPEPLRKMEVFKNHLYIRQGGHLVDLIEKFASSENLDKAERTRQKFFCYRKNGFQNDTEIKLIEDALDSFVDDAILPAAKLLSKQFEEERPKLELMLAKIAYTD